jgi:hypothetical protein
MSELILQRIQQWDVEHGDDPILIGGWLYFRDGAKRENHLYGQFIDPPEDPYERWKLIAKYRGVRLERAVHAFDQKKHELRQQAQNVVLECSRPDGGLPPAVPGEEEFDQLRVLQGTVKRLQRKLDEARAKVEAHQPDWIKASETIAAELREAAKSALTVIDRFEV